MERRCCFDGKRGRRLLCPSVTVALLATGLDVAGADAQAHAAQKAAPPFKTIMPFSLEPPPARPSRRLDFGPIGLAPALRGAIGVEDIEVIGHRAPARQGEDTLFAPASLPETNDAYGARLHGLFPCCASPYENGLDGQPGR